MRYPLLAATALLAATCGHFSAAVAQQPAAPAGPADVHPAIKTAVEGPARKDSNRVRDKYRNPAETLSFFQIEPGQTVVEFYPGGGWYTEILSPLLAGNGEYVALVPAQNVEKFRTFAKENAGRIGTVQVEQIDPATGASSLKPGSADRILTFRNMHNLVEDPASAQRMLAAFHAALKPGGILGVVDHRLPEDADPARDGKSGYMKRSTMVQLAEAAGFTLVGESEVNANPKDTADYPGGVWTLPPTLMLKDVDRDKYLAIGESDRFTMKFRKADR